MAAVDESPGVTRSVNDFYLDRYEVTVGRFAAYVATFALPRDGAGAHPRVSGSGWQPSWEELPNLDFDSELAVPASVSDLLRQLTDEEHCSAPTWSAGVQTLPINCVNWYVAFAFCAFDGGRLPTEAEWNYAASFGETQRVYPWSQPANDATILPAHAAYYHPPDALALLPDAVGSHGDGRGGWGHDDLAGNVIEWVADQWLETLPASCDRDCQATWSNVDQERVARGGAYQNASPSLRTGVRNDVPAFNISRNFGFRCARDITTKSN